jgi:enoyl-[acyl-carrier protein] reductase II
MSLLAKLQIQYPIIQAGMVWVSGAKLAAAAANAGCLGTIGAGSMKPELLAEHIKKAKSLTPHSLAVNVPLLYEKAPEQIQVAIDGGIKIFITSAGSPKLFTEKIKSSGGYVIHVISTPELAQKCEAAGVDAVVAEGFEAGGHNGRDELTTLTLVPQVVDSVRIPVIAAGGIADGRGLAAVLALGASAAQIGTRFVATQEASAHEKFKKLVVDSKPTDTMLMMKNYVPVRLYKNEFFHRILQAEKECAPKERLIEILGKGKARSGMLEGNIEDGEIEIGQVSALIKDIPSVNDLVQRLMAEYNQIIKQQKTY